MNSGSVLLKRYIIENQTEYMYTVFDFLIGKFDTGWKKERDEIREYVCGRCGACRFVLIDSLICINHYYYFKINTKVQHKDGMKCHRI